jgi:carbonic anhydrase
MLTCGLKSGFDPKKPLSSPTSTDSLTMHTFLRILGLLSLLLASSAFANSLGSEAGTRPSPEAALLLLMEGNQRFVQGAPRHPHQTVDRRTATASSQTPFAVILTCADSRLSPEIVFDQGIGDIFVIRNAGNLLSDHVIGSIEYAVEHLHAPLVVVMGHTRCGAIAAAVAGGEATGKVQSIVTSLAPIVESARARAGNTADQAEKINAKIAATAVAASQPLLAPAEAAGRLKVVAARYNLETGAVEWLP